MDASTLPPPPQGFKYEIDPVTQKVVLDASGKPKLVSIDAAGETASAAGGNTAPATSVGVPIDSSGAKSANSTTSMSSSVAAAPATTSSANPVTATAAAATAGVAAAGAAAANTVSAGTSGLAAALSTETVAKETAGAAKTAIELDDFVPDSAKQVKDTTAHTFDQVTSFASHVLEDPGDAAADLVHGASDFVQDFFKFISRGNVLDLAVGIIVGNAFTAIVNSLVNDMISPILGLMGNKELSAYNTVMRPGLSGNTSYPTPAQAKADGAISLAWGSFIEAIINFFIISLVVFLMVKLIGLFYRKKETVSLVCFWCLNELKAGSRRCGNCGSTIPTKEQENAISALEKQAKETLDSMKDATDLDKVAVEAQLLQNTNAVMTGVGASTPVAVAKTDAKVDGAAAPSN